MKKALLEACEKVENGDWMREESVERTVPALADLAPALRGCVGAR